MIQASPQKSNPNHKQKILWEKSSAHPSISFFWNLPEIFLDALVCFKITVASK
jgi:hypothetical protein